MKYFQDVSNLYRVYYHVPEIVDGMWQTALGGDVVRKLLTASVILWLKITNHNKKGDQ